MEAGGRPSSLQGSIRENTVIRHKITPGIFLIISGIYEVGVGGVVPKNSLLVTCLILLSLPDFDHVVKIRVSSAILIFQGVILFLLTKCDILVLLANYDL